MDDYYGLLGIEAEASVDDIRGAYRERKSGIDTTSASGRASAAQLNKAWNVLSDPYQRGRYDEQRAVAMEAGTFEDDDVAVEVSTNGSKSGATPDDRRARSQSAREARVAAQRTPTITLPEGLKWPRQKQRIIALVIDLAVVLVLFAGSQFLIVSLEKSGHRATYDAHQQLVNHAIPDAQKQTSNDNKALDKAKKANASQGEVKRLQNAVTVDKDKETALNKELDSLNKKLAPTEQTITIAFLLISLAYLVVPSALTGRTLGKRRTHIKVVRENGDKLGWSGAVVRYGLLVIVAYFLSLLIGPFAPVIVLFGVTMWMRNGNMQGLHDRIAHTIVVSDEKG